MKAEERHELKQNDLASWIQYGLPMFLKQNGSYLLLALALCFLGYQLYSLYERKQDATRREGWAALMEVQSSSSATRIENPPAKLQSIIDTYNNPELKAQAYLTLGTFYSRVILFPEQMSTLKVTKDEALTKAYDAFKKADELEGADVLVAAKSHLGMAAVKEDQGDWDAAAKEYALLADKNGRFKDTPFTDLAQQRLDTLDERKNAPRMAALIPSTVTTQPSLPSLPGTFGPTLPELGIGGGSGGGGPTPSFTVPDMANPALPGGAVTPAIPTTPATSQPQ
jgi:hypothetical protein